MRLIAKITGKDIFTISHHRIILYGLSKKVIVFLSKPIGRKHEGILPSPTVTASTRFVSVGAMFNDSDPLILMGFCLLSTAFNSTGGGGSKAGKKKGP